MPNKKNRRMFLISNMYPSRKNVRYGIFVKRFEENLKCFFKIKKIVLTKKNNFLLKGFGYFILYSRIIFLYFKARKEDIVYVHFPLYFSFLLFPFIWLKIPLVLNFHGSDIIFDNKLKQFFSIFLRPIVLKCDKIVIPSEYYREKIEKLLAVPYNKLYVYPSGGVDKNIFYPLKNKNEIFIFGFVSNFIRKKGWTVFLEALSLLKSDDSTPRFRAIMVGDGPDRINIEEEIKVRNLDVTLVHSVEQSELVKLYALFDVFVFPTYREEESLGLVGLEALMCGVPVIASKVGGPMGYIKDGYNGFLFEKQNSNDLAQKMKKYQSLTNQKVLKIKQNCIETAMDYESQKVKAGLLELLIKI